MLVVVITRLKPGAGVDALINRDAGGAGGRCAGARDGGVSTVMLIPVLAVVVLVVLVQPALLKRVLFRQVAFMYRTYHFLDFVSIRKNDSFTLPAFSQLCLLLLRFWCVVGPYSICK